MIYSLVLVLLIQLSSVELLVVESFSDGLALGSVGDRFGSLSGGELVSWLLERRRRHRSKESESEIADKKCDGG